MIEKQKLTVNSTNQQLAVHTCISIFARQRVESGASLIIYAKNEDHKSRERRANIRVISRL